MTKIEWTDRVWNPVTGCTKISQGCKHCYAERMAKRLAGRCGYPPAPHQFDVTLHPERLEDPLHWKKPGMVFVNSMSDLFHDDVPGDFIADVFRIMEKTPQHTYQVLTKRPENMLQWTRHYNAERPLSNVWLGVSAEDQYTADKRIPWLLKTPAAVRFVSCEPLLGKVDLFNYMGQIEPALDWVIVGGESGPGARPMHPEWARYLRDQCLQCDVPLFFKQWGGVRKSKAGRILDGVLYNGYPGEE